MNVNQRRPIAAIKIALEGNSIFLAEDDASDNAENLLFAANNKYYKVKPRLAKDGYSGRPSLIIDILNNHGDQVLTYKQTCQFCNNSVQVDKHSKSGMGWFFCKGCWEKDSIRQQLLKEKDPSPVVYCQISKDCAFCKQVDQKLRPQPKPHQGRKRNRQPQSSGKRLRRTQLVSSLDDFIVSDSSPIELLSDDDDNNQ